MSVAFALAVALAGCTQDDDPAVDSLADPSGSPTTNDTGSDSASAEKFGKCMRDGVNEHGIDPAVLDDEPKPGEPPPTESAEDQLTPDEEEALDEVRASCAKYRPELTEEDKEEERENLLAAAQCMRDKGFDDYPDPVPMQDGFMMSIPEEWAEDPAFLAAEEECYETYAPDPGDSEDSA